MQSPLSGSPEPIGLVQEIVTRLPVRVAITFSGSLGRVFARFTFAEAAVLPPTCWEPSGFAPVGVMR
jgi:hypothetical protein